MKTHFIHFSWLPALLGLLSVTGQAIANPEVGADYSSTTGSVAINTISDPVVLQTVTVVCPVAGFTIAHADTQFALTLRSGATEGILGYGISRNSIAFDFNHYHLLESDDGVTYNPGAISRFDTCRAGETVQYKFMAFISSGLSIFNTYASQPKLSVVSYRDRY